MRSAGQGDIGRGKLRPGAQYPQGVLEGSAGPRGVGGDLNNYGFHEGQRHGFIVPVEPVQGCAFTMAGHGCSFVGAAAIVPVPGFRSTSVAWTGQTIRSSPSRMRPATTSEGWVIGLTAPTDDL